MLRALSKFFFFTLPKFLLNSLEVIILERAEIINFQIYCQNQENIQSAIDRVEYLKQNFNESLKRGKNVRK